MKVNYMDSVLELAVIRTQSAEHVIINAHAFVKQLMRQTLNCCNVVSVTFCLFQYKQYLSELF